MNASLRVASVRGIPIEIHPSWFITFLLVSLTLAVGLFPVAHPGLPAGAYWLMGVVAALLFFASVLFHELAHSFVALRDGIPIRRIILFIFGGLAQIGAEPDRPGVEFRVAIAGPLSSFGLAAAFGLLSYVFGLLGLQALLLVAAYLMRMNFMLAVFNLVPAFPLDGGRVLRALLWKRTGSFQRATEMAGAVGQGLAVVLLGLGVWSVLWGQVLQGLWMGFLGWFLYQAAQSGSAQVALRRSLAGVPVSHLMSTQVQSVEADTPLTRLVEDYFYRYRYTAFPVLRGGELVGVVSLREVRTAGPDTWDRVQVGEVAVPLTEQDLIEPDADAADALLRMAERGVGRLLVVERGELVGLISHTDILRLIKIQQELRF